MSGFIKLYRGWSDNPAFKDEPLTEREAFLWMIECAAWKDVQRRCPKGEVITVLRGQFHTAERTLATAWKWDRKRVARYLKRLKNSLMIDPQTGPHGTLITICNYEKYQGDGANHGATDGTNDGANHGANHGATQEEVKKFKEGKKKEDNARKRADAFPCPDGVDPIDWEGLKANRKAKRAALTEGAYRQITAKLERWHREGWPPGPVVAYAAERGWTTVFETDEMKVTANGNGNRKVNGKSIDRRSSLARAIDEGLDWIDGPQAGVS